MHWFVARVPGVNYIILYTRTLSKKRKQRYDMDRRSMINKHAEIGVCVPLLPAILQIDFMAWAYYFFKAFITPLYEYKCVKDVLKRLGIDFVKRMINDSLLCPISLPWVQRSWGRTWLEYMERSVETWVTSNALWRRRAR